MARCKYYSSNGIPPNPEDLCYSCLKAEVCNYDMENHVLSWGTDSATKALYGVLDRDCHIDVDRTVGELEMNIEMVVRVCGTMTEEL